MNRNIDISEKLADTESLKNEAFYHKDENLVKFKLIKTLIVNLTPHTASNFKINKIPSPKMLEPICTTCWN